VFDEKYFGSDSSSAFEMPSFLVRNNLLEVFLILWSLFYHFEHLTFVTHCSNLVSTAAFHSTSITAAFEKAQLIIVLLYFHSCRILRSLSGNMYCAQLLSIGR